VWIYKGDILPYKTSTEDKITREAAMAVGETSGAAARPRRIISAGGGRRLPGQEEPGSATGAAPTGNEVLGPEDAALLDGATLADDATSVDDTELAAPAPLIPEADPERERLLAEEEEIERRTREHHETPHFRSGDE
jgi:small subunit ribosomal protein S3